MSELDKLRKQIKELENIKVRDPVEFEKRERKIQILIRKIEKLTGDKRNAY
jgi:hypothetical protein